MNISINGKQLQLMVNSFINGKQLLYVFINGK